MLILVLDIYYWPEPNADSSCLSVVGNTVNPPQQGATTSCFSGQGCVTYWGADLCCQPNGEHYIQTTATWTTINGIAFKNPLFDPWQSQSEWFGLTAVTASNSTNLPLSSSVSLPVNPMPIRVRAPGNQTDSRNVAGQDANPSIAIVDGHTL